MPSHFVGKISVRAIIEKDGKVLITQDPRDKLWETPGGRIDEGEDVISALRREMREEIGAEIVIGPLVHSGQFFHMQDNAMQLMLTFACTLANPDASLAFEANEISDMRWITASAIEDFAFIGDCKASLLTYWQQR